MQCPKIIEYSLNCSFSTKFRDFFLNSNVKEAHYFLSNFMHFCMYTNFELKFCRNESDLRLTAHNSVIYVFLQHS